MRIYVEFLESTELNGMIFPKGKRKFINEKYISNLPVKVIELNNGAIVKRNIEEISKEISKKMNKGRKKYEQE